MDPYLRLLSDNALPGRLARTLAGRLGLPRPVTLRRYSPTEPLVPGTVWCGGTDGWLGPPAIRELAALSAHVHDPSSDTHPAPPPPYAVLLDLSGITHSADLRDAYAFLQPVIRRIETCGRLLVLGSDPEHCDTVAEATAQAALDGLVRSAAKEVPRGCTANLLRVAPGAEHALAGPLGFLLSRKSAYVSGQVLQLRAPDSTSSPDPESPPEIDWSTPLKGHTILVTGAARGIGAEIARTLARDGGFVLCLDRPEQRDTVTAVAEEVGGSPLLLDITTDEAPDAVADQLTDDHGGVDAVVHNAGVLRDRTLGRMSRDEWDTVLAVNLSAQERLDAALFDRAVLRPAGRLVSIASVSGIAGNRGQTNYATSKAGVIGRVRALAERKPIPGLTVNAVAPGFIESEMARSMPILPREVGRRFSSLGQGGLPIDVAETVAFLVSPGSYAVNGNVIRVCGQSMLGA